MSLSIVVSGDDWSATCEPVGTWFRNESEPRSFQVTIQYPSPDPKKAKQPAPQERFELTFYPGTFKGSPWPHAEVKGPRSLVPRALEQTENALRDFLFGVAK